MKKLFTLLICIGSLLLGFTSCGDEAFDLDSVNRQTLLVFFPWSGGTNTSGLYSDLLANVDNMCEGIKAQKGLSNARVLVFMSKNSRRSHLFELKYDATQKEVIRDTLKTYDDGSFYNSPEGIASVISDVKSQAEALNYAMIIGCHGCGWTYAADWVSYPNFARPNNGASWGASTGANTSTSSDFSGSADNFSSSTDNFSGIQYGEDSNHPKTRFFGSVTLDDAAIDVSTLAEGIKLSNTKMQYILFDACYMSNVETAYELKDVTNFLVASCSEVLSEGLPYSTIWSSLVSNAPNYSNIVSSSVNYYAQSSTPACNLAAIDCRQMDKLASVMKEINASCTLSSSVPLDSLQPLGGFRPNIFYDMSVYVDSLKPAGYLKDKFTSQLKSTVKAAQSTPSVITSLWYRDISIPVKTYCGLSISDPSTHSVAIKGREKSGWWKATH